LWNPFRDGIKILTLGPRTTSHRALFALGKLYSPLQKSYDSLMNLGITVRISMASPWLYRT
jgi:hypothetical protein